MIKVMTVVLPDAAKALLDAPTYIVLTTLNPDGSPQSTVMWIKRDGEDVVFSTLLGRKKARNLERDPRASVCFYDPANPYVFFTVEGEVTMDPAGGRELINELSMKYGGKPYPEESPDKVRLVCRLTPAKILER